MNVDSAPTPEITAVNAPFWAAIDEGRLIYQQCACGHAWLPPRAECPNCLTSRWKWLNAKGIGTIVSWVVYRTAYHHAYKHATPYNVSIVELCEGPRLITNILGCPDGRGLKIDAEVQLCPLETQRQHCTQFYLSSSSSPSWTPPPSRRSGSSKR